MLLYQRLKPLPVSRQILVILQQRETGGRKGDNFEELQVLHSDKPPENKFQPGGPKEGWRAAVPEGGPGAAGTQGRGVLGCKTEH